MAIASGPRVCLYGGTQVSSLARALVRKRKGRVSTRELIDTFNGDEEGDGEDGGGEGELGTVVPDRSLSTGGFPVHHTAYHADGRLLAIACDNGCIKVCDSTSRATLRTFLTTVTDGAASGGVKKDKGLPVRSVGWLPERTRRSAGEEAKKMLWSGDVLLVTGSYDHTVRVWNMHGIDGRNKAMTALGEDDEEDLDDSRCMSIMDHGAPVECLFAIQHRQNPTDARNKRRNGRQGTNNKDTNKDSKNDNDSFPIVISAGGTTIKLWNPILGTCLSTIQTKHSKTITSLCMASIVRQKRDDDNINLGDNDNGDGTVVCKRLLSAGLDGLIRIYAADELYHHNENNTKSKRTTNNNNYSLPYLHGTKTAHPITSLALSPDNTKLVIGTSVGLITVRQRAKYVPQGKKLVKRPEDAPRAGTYSYFMRGQDVKADADDHVVSIMKRRKLQSFDVALKEFRYGDALDDALRIRDVKGIMAVLEELGRRKGLIQALSNRDEETLEPLLAFTASTIQVPSHTPVLVGVANLLCEIYSDVFGQSERIDEYFRKLHLHVRNEVSNQKILLRLVGQIDAVMYQAEVTTTAVGAIGGEDE